MGREVKVKRYFLTVDWCGQGNRGIFCSAKGDVYPKDKVPHTVDEMSEILGDFSLILDPESQLFSEEEMGKYTKFYPLAEYTRQYGVAREA